MGSPQGRRLPQEQLPAPGRAVCGHGGQTALQGGGGGAGGAAGASRGGTQAFAQHPTAPACL